MLLQIKKVSGEFSPRSTDDSLQKESQWSIGNGEWRVVFLFLAWRTKQSVLKIIVVGESAQVFDCFSLKKESVDVAHALTKLSSHSLKRGSLHTCPRSEDPAYTIIVVAVSFTA